LLSPAGKLGSVVMFKFARDRYLISEGEVNCSGTVAAKRGASDFKALERGESPYKIG